MLLEGQGEILEIVESYRLILALPADHLGHQLPTEEVLDYRVIPLFVVTPPLLAYFREGVLLGVGS